jgi:tetratricopeptide (TPR) repeat protein
MSPKNYREDLDPDEKIALAKKRKKEIHMIRKGDYFFMRNAPEDALEYYQRVQEKLGDDQIVAKKIASVYFALKNWTKAYETYITVPFHELSEEEKDHMLESLFSDESRSDRLTLLSKFPYSSGTIEYYHFYETCLTDTKWCIDTLSSYTGSEYRITDLSLQLETAKKLTTDPLYPSLLLAAKLYTYHAYRLSEKLTSDILSRRPDYMEAYKILGFSLYELGKYEWAKKYLLLYLEKSPKDLDSIVRMGEISAKLGDLVGSNLYLNNAVTSGYKNKTDIERQLAYNYYLLGDTMGMQKVLTYLQNEDDSTEEDALVAISLAIQDGEYGRAREWAERANAKYQNSPLIIPLYIQSLRLLGEVDLASAVLQNTPSEIMKQNPNFSLEKAIIYHDYGDFTSALPLFEELTKLTDWPDIVSEAQVYIDRIHTLQSP